MQVFTFIICTAQIANSSLIFLVQVTHWVLF